jgi:hypothetical protein
LTQVNLEVGEKIFNDVTKMNGEIVGITETDVTINWQDGNDLVEEVMAIDELSKATLKNYITKASTNAFVNAYTAGQDKDSGMVRNKKGGWSSGPKIRNAVNRVKGINTAASKLAKEDIDFSIGDQFELEDDLFEITNIDGDNVELRNGDDELFEISASKLQNYIHAATDDATDRSQNRYLGKRYRADTGEKEDKAETAANNRSIRNRRKGVKRAIQKITKEEKEMNEDSMALQTLKPGSRPANDPMSIPSKLDMMKKVLTMLGNVEYNGDQVQFLNKALEYIGKEAHMIGDGDAAKNKSTVACHNPSLKEDVEKLFEGQEVSEEFKEKTSNLFEAAVALRTSLLEAEIQEAYENALNEEVAELEEIFAEELSTIEENNEMYMNYVAEKWLEENQVAIESTLRNEITEQFIDGLKNLFVEHYIDIPEDKVDVLANLEEENKELSETIHALLQEKTELENAIAEATAESAFDEIVEGMNVADIEKLKTLAEHVEFDGNIDSYKDKIKFIKESHFTRGKRPVVKLDDSFIGEESVRYATPLVAATARILNEGKH